MLPIQLGAPDLPDWLDRVSLGAAVLWVLGIVTIYLILRPVIKLLKKASNLFDDLLGEPARPGVPERPGIMKRMELIEKSMHELPQTHITRQEFDAIIRDIYQHFTALHPDHPVTPPVVLTGPITHI